jgi:hypothetical protein
MSMTASIRRHAPLKIIAFGLFALASASAVAAQSRIEASLAAPAPEYWLRAVVAWERGQAYRPRAMTMRFTELDRNGQAKSVTLNEYGLSYVGDQPRYELIRSTKDGKDQTEKAKAEEAKRSASARGGPGGPPGSSGSSDPLASMPFSDKIPGPLELGQPRAAGSAVSLPYAIKHDKQGSEGVVFFDERLRATRIEYRPKPLPAMVSEFFGVMRLWELPDGALVLSTMEFSGEGGVLFVRIRFSVGIEFSSYEKF